MPTSASHADTAGFTLIELMVVLAIIGILIAVALPVISSRSRTLDQGKALTALDVALVAARDTARRTGRPQTLAVATVIERSRYTNAAGQTLADLTVYPDASSSGGVVAVDGRPAASIDWLTSAVSAAK